MALADIKIETAAEAQVPVKIELNGEDVTRFVHRVETKFDAEGGAPSTVLHFRGAAEITHNPNETPPWKHEADFVPEEPAIDDLDACEGCNHHRRVHLEGGECDMPGCPCDGFEEEAEDDE